MCASELAAEEAAEVLHYILARHLRGMLQNEECLNGGVPYVVFGRNGVTRLLALGFDEATMGESWGAV